MKYIDIDPDRCGGVFYGQPGYASEDNGYKDDPDAVIGAAMIDWSKVPKQPEAERWRPSPGDRIRCRLDARCAAEFRGLVGVVLRVYGNKADVRYDSSPYSQLEWSPLLDFLEPEPISTPPGGTADAAIPSHCTECGRSEGHGASCSRRHDRVGGGSSESDSYEKCRKLDLSNDIHFNNWQSRQGKNIVTEKEFISKGTNYPVSTMSANRAVVFGPLGEKQMYQSLKRWERKKGHPSTWPEGSGDDI